MVRGQVHIFEGSLLGVASALDVMLMYCKLCTTICLDLLLRRLFTVILCELIICWAEQYDILP